MIADMAGTSHKAALEELISSYFELNSSAIEELDEEPSPLEFMRYVARNKPFVVRGGASSWKAVQDWDAAYLRSALDNQMVNVAVTPKGNADSPTICPETGTTLFAKPHEEDQPFNDFLDYIVRQERDPSFPPDSEIRYAQTQNDNLRDEYSALVPDAQPSIPFARIALQKAPDAVNLWIGNSCSVTATHKDNFENIFVQVRGRKHFVLLPPLCYPCMNETPLQPASYVREGDYLGLKVEEGDRVPFVTWDPDRPDGNATEYSALAQPMRVTLEPGDMLYLPAMWYHKVSQSSIDGDEGFVVAINYWYDMEFSGPLYAMASFVQNSTLAERSSRT